MKCPACECSIPITWPAYLKSPLGRYTCPQCNSQLQLRHSLPYYAASLGICAAFCVLPTVLALYLSNRPVLAIVLCVIGTVITLVADKYIDDTWRGAVVRGSGASKAQ